MTSLSTPRRSAHGLPSPLIAAALGFLLVLLSLPFGPAPTRAQPASGLEIELVRQPTFHRGGDTLGLGIKVTNTTESDLEGFAIQAAVHTRVTTRTGLHESYSRPTGGTIGVYNQDFERAVPAGESVTVTLDPRLDEHFSLLTLAGVYPLTVSLYDDPGVLSQLLDDFTTELVFYPEEIERPLNMALIVPLSPQAARGPSGAFETDETGNHPLEVSLGSGGWLSGLLSGLEEGLARGLRVGVAPSPRFAEELAGMSNGYARESGSEIETVEPAAPTSSAAEEAFESLQRVLAKKRSVQPLMSPYSSPDLPTIYQRFRLEHLTAQLDTGRETLETVFPDVTFDPKWLFAPGSRWDEQTLEEVEQLQEDLHTFVGSTFFEEPIDETVPGCPSIEVAPVTGSFTCPVAVETDAGDVVAYVRDPDVQNRFAALAAGGEDALDLQRFFAETAFIHLERPTEPRRMVHATVPSHWEPNPRTSSRLFRGLASAPWLDLRTPDEGLEYSANPRPRSLEERLPQLDEAPSEEYFAAITEAGNDLEIFEELGPPDSRRERLQKNLLVAESRTWWDASKVSQGMDFAVDTRREIIEEFGKVSVSGPNTTLTSKRSAIEVNVFNETNYPVTVDVAFEFPGAIRIAQSDVDELQDITVQPGGAPAVNVDVIADTSGIFQVTAAVLSPDSGRPINEENITIQSTNFNQIALGLTFGALAFLILFYVLRVIRRRRKPTGAPAESTDT